VARALTSAGIAGVSAQKETKMTVSVNGYLIQDISAATQPLRPDWKRDSGTSSAAGRPVNRRTARPPVRLSDNRKVQLLFQRWSLSGLSTP
jgi:hypothetical protein